MNQPSSFDYEQLLACSRGELFGPGNARLPAPPMLMFDRITHVSTEGIYFPYDLPFCYTADCRIATHLGNLIHVHGHQARFGA